MTAALLTTHQAHAQEQPPGCTGSGLGISLFVSQNTAHVGEILTYDVLVFNTEFPACLATAVVASITTPDGVSHPIELRRTSLNPGESDFYPNVVSYTIRAQDLLDNIPDGSYVRARGNTDGDIHQNEELSRGGGFQGVNTVVAVPCIDVNLICVDEIGEDGTITYTGTVINCGDIPLTNVIVVSNFEGVQNQVIGPINLAIGESFDFSFTVAPSNPCGPVTASVEATGRDALPVTVSVSDTAQATCALQLTPRILIENFCPPTASAGGSFNYSGRVTNDGNVTLVDVVVVSDQPAPNTVVFQADSIAPGASVDFSAQFTAPFACEITSVLNVRASSVCGVNVSDQSTATCPLDIQPGIEVTKLCPPEAIAPGQLFSYDASVRNIGNVTLRQVQVVSDFPSANTVVFSRAALAPGELVNFSVQARASADVCAITETLTATGQDACENQVVQDTASTTCPVLTNAAIEIDHSCPTPPARPGAPLTFSGTVRNTGDVSLVNVTVFSDLPAANTVVLTLATLPPGASENFSGTITAPANACSVATTLTARASDSCGGAQIVDVSTLDCPLDTTPDIDVTLNCPPEPVLPGHPMAFTGSVANTGDIDLIGVVVVSRFDDATVFGPATLAPGQTASFNGGFVLPEGINACDFSSTVVATGADRCTGTEVSADASAACPLLIRPAIRVTRECPPDPVAQGARLTYQGTVINIGNITLNNIVVVSERPAPNTQVFTIASLLPGASANFTGDFIVPGDCCSVKDTLLATAADVCDGTVVSDSSTSICPVLFNPGLQITKECPENPVRPGQALRYTGVVTNSGDITLTDVTVFSSYHGRVFPYLGPINLAPGETADYAVSYIVRDGFCGMDMVTVEGLSVCGDVPVSSSATLKCPVLTNPAIHVTSSCPPEPLSRGQSATFTGTVTNTGDAALIDVMISHHFVLTDRDPSDESNIAGPLTMAPGESIDFTFDLIMPNDWECCGIADTVTARGVDLCSSEMVSSTSTTVCPILTQPGLRVSMECPVGSFADGDWVEYFGTVENIGDIVLSDVTVIGRRGGVDEELVGPFALAAGETEFFYAMYLKEGGGPAAPLIVTASGIDVCTGNDVVGLPVVIWGWAPIV